MSSSYTNTKRRRVKSSKTSKLQKRVKLVAYLTATTIAVIAIANIVHSTRTGDNVVVEKKFPHGTLDQLTKPTHFKQAYLSVHCTNALRHNTHSIRFVGEIQSGDRNEPFTLFKKRPDLTLMTIDRGSHEITFGVNDERVWRRIRSPQHEDRFALIEGDEAAQWLKQRHFFDRIIRATQGNGRITAIEATTWEATDCLKVTTQHNEDGTVDTLIDPLTMYPIAELKILPDNRIKQIVLNDYRTINGMPIPFEITNSVDNAVQSRIQLRSVKLNPGVLSSLFEVPESLLTND